MQVADPQDACSPFTFTNFDIPWIALISRQQLNPLPNCTFDYKVWCTNGPGWGEGRIGVGGMNQPS